MLSVDALTRITKYRSGAEQRADKMAELIATHHIYKQNGSVVVMSKEAAQGISNIMTGLINAKATKK